MKNMYLRACLMDGEICLFDFCYYLLLAAGQFTRYAICIQFWKIVVQLRACKLHYFPKLTA